MHFSSALPLLLLKLDNLIVYWFLLNWNYKTILNHNQQFFSIPSDG